MKKRTVSFMLTLCMVLTLLPAGGMTVKAATLPGEVYVGGVNVVDNDPTKTTFWVNDSGSITNNGADENNYNVKYDPSSATLYLKEAIINNTYTKKSDTLDYVYGIYCNGGDLNIVIEEAKVIKVISRCLKTQPVIQTAYMFLMT